MDGLTRLPGRAKSNDRGMFQRNGLNHPEEFDVLGIRARPASLDEVHAQFIQLLSDTHFIFRRKTHVFSLCAVSQGRVIDFQRWQP